MSDRSQDDPKVPRVQADLLQDAIYRIVQAAERAESLDDLLPRLHTIVNEVMPASNFYIALYDEQDDTIQFPYFVDEVDAPPPSGKQPFGRGLTEYVLRTGRSLLCDQAMHEKLEREGKVELVGVASPIWLGVPLILEGRSIGAMVVQHYRDASAYGEREKRMLEFVSGQIAASIGRRQKEDAVRESESRYRRLFEDSPVAIWEEDFNAVRVFLDTLWERGIRDLRAHFAAHPEDLIRCAGLVKVVDVNQATLKLYGASSKREFYKNLVDVIPPEELHVFQKEILAFFEGQTWFEEQSYNYRLDGNRLDIILRCTVAPGSEKSLSRVLVSIVDITSQKQIESALRASEENFRSLFVNVPDGVYRTTTDGRILDANPALVSMLGFESLEELLQHRVQDLYAFPGGRDKFVSRLETTGEARNMELILRRKDGRELVCLDNSRAVRNPDGQVLYYEGVLTDITERKFAEGRLQEKIITLELLAEIDRQILAATDIDTVMRLVCANAAALLHTPKAVVASRISGGEMRINATYGLAHSESIKSEIEELNLERQSPAWRDGVRATDLVPETGLLTKFRRHEEVRAMLIEPFALDPEHSGLVMVFDLKPRAWSGDEVDLLRLLTGQAAIALERARLFSETRRHAEELRLRNLELDRLYRVSGSLISSISFDVATLAQTMVKIVLAEFPDANISLFLIDETNRFLRRVNSQGPYTHLFKFDRLAIDGPGLVVKAVRSGETILINDVHQSPDYLPGWEAARSELTVPLVVKDRVIGALDVQSAQNNAYSESDQRLLSVFAMRAALLIENARLYTQTEVRMQRLTTLRAIDLAIASSLDLRITLSLLLEQVTTQLSVDAAAVMLFNPAMQILQYTAGRGFLGSAIEHVSLRVGEGLAGQSAIERTIVGIADIASATGSQAYAERLAGERIVTGYAVPLVAKGTLKGVLELFFRRPFEPDLEWPDFIETLARQAAIAIEDAELFESLQRSNTELAVAYDATIESWARALELRGKEPEGHSLRITELMLELVRSLGMEESRLVHIYRGALLHDIGLLVVPDEVLSKTEALSETDWKEIRKHPQYARDLLYPIVHLHPAIAIPYCHHEAWDGSGYPRGLSGLQIPLEARAFAVVDCWDAMQNHRPYRAAVSRQEAIQYLREQSGKKFDPQVVESFLRLMASG